MGRGKNKQKYKQKKTPTEVKAYKNSLGKNSTGMTGTVDENSPLLTGSDMITSEYGGRGNQDIPKARKPISLAISDWIRDNVISIIVTVFILPFFIWIASNIININKEMAVSEYRIDKLEENIDDISDDIPNKRELEMQFQMLKETINKYNIDDLKDRITALELEVKKANENNKDEK